MSNQERTISLRKNGTIPGRTELWLSLSILAALLAIVGNIIALSIPGIYASLTAAFLPQAIAQDIASLAIVSPLWLILALLALRGSLRAYLLWQGFHKVAEVSKSKAALGCAEKKRRARARLLNPWERQSPITRLLRMAIL